MVRAGLRLQRIWRSKDTVHIGTLDACQRSLTRSDKAQLPEATSSKQTSWV
jgi:hypothetical protein